MDFATWIDTLRREGRRLADAAVQVDPEAPAPSCPDWSVRDLVHHTGRVHRWAGMVISEARPEPPTGREVLPDGLPSDEGLEAWFREGHEQILAALESAPNDLECWTIMGAPSPRNFWARRQAHETSIHRVDAELAAGADLSGFDPMFAADGVDELLVWFISRPGRRLSAPRAMTLGVVATDVDRDWTATFGPEVSRGRRGMGETDCTLAGAAADLYPFLWNRTPLGDLRVEGDREVLERWQESSAF